MKLIPLPEDKIRALENNSIPIVDFIFTSGRHDLFLKYMKLLNWYHVNGLTTNDTQTARNQKMIQLLQCQPAYSVTYEFENAVWGFSFDGMSFIIYLSEQGLAIQCDHNFTIETAEHLVNHLSSILLN